MPTVNLNDQSVYSRSQNNVNVAYCNYKKITSSYSVITNVICPIACLMQVLYLNCLFEILKKHVIFKIVTFTVLDQQHIEIFNDAITVQLRRA